MRATWLDGRMDSVRGSVRLDTERFGVDAFRDGWEAQIGDGFTLPAFHHEATAGAVVRGLAEIGDRKPPCSAIPRGEQQVRGQ